MNVLYYCPEYFCSHGARTHAREFFHALQHHPAVDKALLFGQERTVLPVDAASPVPAAVRLSFLPRSLRLFVRFWIPRRQLTEQLARWALAEQADVLVIRTGDKFIQIDRLRRMLPNTRIVLEINAALVNELFPGLPARALFERLEVMRWRPAHRFVVVSSHLQEYLVRRGIDSADIVVNPNGVNTALFHPADEAQRAAARQQAAIAPDAFVLGYVGGMEPFRRLPQVIEQFARLRRAGLSNLHLLLIGDGEDRPAVDAAIARHGRDLEGAVSLLGWRPYEEVAGLMAAFDVAIFPYTNPYCSPLKLFEYLACGLPVIGPDTPAVREAVRDGEHLRLADQDGGNFEQLVRELYGDPAMCRRLAEQGRRWITDRYTWRANVDRVLNGAPVPGQAAPMAGDSMSLSAPESR